MSETTETTERDLFGARKGEYEVPELARPATCQSCGAPIVFTKTPKGATIPLSLATVEWREGKRYAITHFSDCPNARDWSGKGRRR